MLCMGGLCATAAVKACCGRKGGCLRLQQAKKSSNGLRSWENSELTVRSDGSEVK